MYHRCCINSGLNLTVRELNLYRCNTGVQFNHMHLAWIPYPSSLIGYTPSLLRSELYNNFNRLGLFLSSWLSILYNVIPTVLMLLLVAFSATQSKSVWCTQRQLSSIPPRSLLLGTPKGKPIAPIRSFRISPSLDTSELLIPMLFYAECVCPNSAAQIHQVPL